MSPFTVRPYEPGDEEGLLALFNRVFAEDNPAFVPRTMEMWRHVYLENPAGMQTFVGLDPDGAIVANYSSIPARAVVRGEARMCTQAVDSCVDKAWRGSLRKRSLFVTIATEFIGYHSTEGREPFDDYMYGLPNEKAFPVGTRIIGYQPVEVPLRAHVRALGDDAEAWLDDLARRADGVEVVDLGLGGVEELAALFERHLDDVPLGIRRDAAYLRWRYAPRPDGVSYGLLGARRHGRLVGAVVYRLGWMGEPVAPLVDWIGDGRDEGAVAALVESVGRAAHGGGGRRLTSWATPAVPHADTLARLGFTREDTSFNLCIMTFGPDFDLGWAREHWFFTMGDSDIF